MTDLFKARALSKIAAERLLDDHPAPGRLLLRRVDQPRLAQVGDDRREKLR